jgi:hypothetical protein
MALSNEYATYYLTNNGWVEVYRKTDFSNEKVNPIPEKYYLICTYREGQSSMYSKMKTSTKIDYRDETESEKINELIRRYGECPQLI